MAAALSESLSRHKRRVERSAVYAVAGAILCLSVGSAGATEYEAAHALIVKKKWSEALPVLERLSQEAPNSVLVGRDLADALLRMNRRNEAMRLLRRFGFLKQAEVAGRTFLHQESYRQYQEGLNFLEEEKYSLARERLEKAYEKDRDQLEILVRLVQVETLDGRTDAALKWVETARTLHGGLTELFLWEGRALSLQKKNSDASKKLAVAARDLPESQNAALWLAESIHTEGDLGGALNVLDADLKRNPLHLSAFAQKIRWELDRFAEGTLTAPEIDVELKLFQTRMEKLNSDRMPRFESELGLELQNPDRLKDELTLIQSRFEELKKRSAL